MLGANDGFQTLGYNTPNVNASLQLPSDRNQVAKFDDLKITSENVLSPRLGEHGGVTKTPMCSRREAVPSSSDSAPPIQAGS